MSADSLEIDERTARALALTSLDRRAVASRLAEIGEFRAPTYDQAIDFLNDVLRTALSYIPPNNAAWSWGEFHNGGLQPLYDMSRKQDWVRQAVCAVDLGLGEHPPSTRDGEALAPRLALARNLVNGTERLLDEVRKRLEAVGVSPYGQPTAPPST